jgi:hypothetical protein
VNCILPFVQRLLFSFLIGAVFLLAGCESSIKERVIDAPPKVQDFAGNLEQVNAAAQRAFKKLDFVLVRKSMGRVEAASSIHHSKAFGDSRQLVAKLSISENVPGTCQVEMWLTQEVAGDEFGGTYRKPLPEHDFYYTYFAALQQVLDENRVTIGAPVK